ncbi:sugar ABC transporter substrate-binding protein [Candidatus Sumerlaeota bacterium]|nr:sugar ABC transporter substrate-binding protein [Candidatus Sumerlaeota bacterium]
MRHAVITIVGAFALLLAVGGASAQPQEIMKPAETVYSPAAKPSVMSAPSNVRRAVPAPVSGQEGIYSDSPWGIATTRRNDPTFHGIMEGLQEAAKKSTGKGINVAPASKEALDDQISDLTAHGANSIIIDAPRAEDAQGIVGNSKFLKINTVVLADYVPQAGFQGAPLIVISPADYGAVGAEGALEILKDAKKGRVIYLVSGPYEDETRTKFLEPLSGKDQYQVIRATEEVKIEPSDLPTALVALTPSDSSRLQSYVGSLPDVVTIASGDSIGVRQIFDIGFVRYRIHTDYEKVFAECQRVIGNPPGAPVLLKPTIDKQTKPPEMPGAPQQ